MLKLPHVTLLAIDVTDKVNRTLLSLEQSMRWVQFGGVVLVTDTIAHDPTLFEPKIKNLRVIHRKQSNTKVSLANQPHGLPIDYERDALILPFDIVTTPFMLFSEWDSGVLNHHAWTDDFLLYDYIGAPWVTHHDPGYPPCTETNNVGNAGFSLQSSKFMQMAQVCTLKAFPNDPTMAIHDSWICRTHRGWMEARGIKYAPESLASRFSCENSIYSGQFGFHGRLTVTMNGWGGKFFEPIRL